jgi:CHAT domain-containing protein
MQTYCSLAAGLVVAAGLAGTATSESPPKPAGPTLTPEQRAKLTERDRMMKEAADLHRAGKLAAATAAVEKAAAIQRDVTGENHPDVADLDRIIAGLSLAREDWATARAARRRVLAVTTALHGKRDWRVTVARVALSDVDLYEKMTPADRAAAARAAALNREAYDLHTKKKYAAARPMCEEALAIRKRVLGENHPEYAVSLYNLARLYWDIREFEKAELLFKQALETQGKVYGDDHPAYADILDRLAELYRDTGESEKAEPLFKRAQVIRKEAVGEHHPDYAGSLHNLAILYTTNGEYRKAEPLFKQGLEICRTAYGENHPDFAVRLYNLARLYEEIGEFGKAEPLLRQALEIRRKTLGDDDPGCAQVLNDLGALYQNVGEIEKAEPLLKQALEIYRKAFGEESSQYAIILGNLARQYETRREYGRAEPLFDQALEIRRKVWGEQHPNYAVGLIDLAHLYKARGESLKAEQIINQALEIRRKVWGVSHPDYADGLYALAQLFMTRGQFGKAELLFTQALEIDLQAFGEGSPKYANGLVQLGLLYYFTGELAKAEPLFRKTLETRLELLDRTAAVQPEESQLAFARDSRARLLAYLDVTAALSGRSTETYALALRWKGQVFLRQRQQRELARAAADKKTADLVARLIAATRRLATFAGKAPGPGTADAWKKQVATLVKQRNDLEYELTRKSAGFREQKEREALTPDQLRKLLPPAVALVDYFVYEHFTPDPTGKSWGTRVDRLVAFVVRPDRDVVRVELGPFNPIREAIESWLRDTKRRRPVRGDNDPAAVLRDKLWLPVAVHLGGITTVLVSPDADLARLPFGALPGSADGAYLIEELAVAVLPVPQFLPDLLTPAAGGPSLLVVGDVDYGADPGKPAAAALSRAAARRGERKGWGPLPATRAEVDAVRAAFGVAFPNAPATVLRGAEPTEDAIRRQFGNHRWVHLATHGFFAPPVEKPGGTGTPAADPELGRAVGHYPGLLSGVALAGANRPLDPLSGADDGVLTAAEVATLDLAGVDTVVLSACETGLGKEAPAEGVLGLQRAFQVAGARTVVATLWAVPDDATRLLMARAYQGWWGGKATKLEALVAAQRWVIANGPAVAGKGGKTPPFYWAAFVLAGDWR